MSLSDGSPAGCWRLRLRRRSFRSCSSVSGRHRASIRRRFHPKMRTGCCKNCGVRKAGTFLVVRHQPAGLRFRGGPLPRKQGRKSVWTRRRPGASPPQPKATRQCMDHGDRRASAASSAPSERRSGIVHCGAWLPAMANRRRRKPQSILIGRAMPSHAAGIQRGDRLRRKVRAPGRRRPWRPRRRRVAAPLSGSLRYRAFSGSARHPSLPESWSSRRSRWRR